MGLDQFSKRNHYIPQLLLRQFATGEHIETYNFPASSFERKKLKNTFSDLGLFDDELEKLFAYKLEGPFGNLLHSKLLHGEMITLNRQENMLLRKFLLINFLRAPIVNTDWDEMIERTKQQDHPSVGAVEFLLRHHPELKTEFEEGMPSSLNYMDNLKKAMEINDLEEIAKGRTDLGISQSLINAARHAMVAVLAFWDASGTEQEFILPKLPGITEMDHVSIFHKYMVLQERRNQLEEEWIPGDLDMELRRLMFGTVLFSDNYSVYPISPTRCIICFSPYFRAFFPMMDAAGKKKLYPPLLNKEHFARHFYRLTRMELFKPCEVMYNQSYVFQVKQLKKEEVFHINSMLLDMETEEFAFHDRNRLRASLWYYDNEAVFAGRKKHDFSSCYR